MTTTNEQRAIAAQNIYPTASDFASDLPDGAGKTMATMLHETMLGEGISPQTLSRYADLVADTIPVAGSTQTKRLTKYISEVMEQLDLIGGYQPPVTEPEDVASNGQVAEVTEDDLAELVHSAEAATA